jgi:hypothetical protein
MSNSQPKIARKMAIRFVIGLFAIAALVFAFNWIRTEGRDPDFGTFRSVDHIAALLETDNGAQAVLIGPDGRIIPSPDYRAGAEDRPPVWGPNKAGQPGTRVFFISDRENQEPHVFRWNPERELVERRTLDRRGKTYLTFDVPGEDGGRGTGLLLSGGTVLEFDPGQVSARQLLPPRGRGGAPGTAEEGAGGQFDRLYEQIGSSFRDAQWGRERRWIVAVMRTEDGGEVLVLQNMVNVEQPTIIAAGDRIEFDVNQQTGMVVYSVMNWRWPDASAAPAEFVGEDGRIRRPYIHMVGLVDPDNPQPLLPVVATPDPEGVKVDVEGFDPTLAFGTPRISPDGQTVLLSAGRFGDLGRIANPDFVLMPAQPGAGAQGRALLRGLELGDPDWHPSGRRIIYTKRSPDGQRAIFTINADGSGERRVTQRGNFRSPRFSPQTE